MADEKKEYRTVIVTGGSKGIGRAICLSFCDDKTKVFFNYAHSDEGAEITESLAAEKGGFAKGVKADMSQAEQVESFFKTVLDECGKIDVLVNNAGITKDGLIVRMKESDWDDVMCINLKGAFLASKHAAKAMMRARYGRIINITSIVGVTGNPGQANYAASKSGIIGLTKSMAKELATRGITVNAIAPGYIETDMTASLSDAVKKQMLDQIPMQTAGTPDDVANAALFLASPMASYITGQVLHVSGGMYM